MRGVLDEIVAEKVDYAAVWVWEFYQTSTYETRNTPPTRASVEPDSLGDGVIRLLVDIGRRLGAAAPLGADAPRVVLTWPLPCAALDRPTELHAIASDGARPVRRVEFLVDGAPLATATSAPYVTQFDPAGRIPHTAAIEARAIGATGAMASFRSTVRLNGVGQKCDPSG
jgi:hypothetical protein